MYFQPIDHSLHARKEIYRMAAESYLLQTYRAICLPRRQLKEITQLPQSALELAESLEQLRWLENGYKIKVGITEQETIGIDTPEDMEKALAFLANR